MYLKVFLVVVLPLLFGVSICRANQGWLPAPSNGNKAAIYPGTKWCGLGDIAHHSDDLGRYHATDKCCREHDKCSDVIKPGTCKHGLCNQSPFTTSHCDCDDRFRECLLRARDPASLPVGKIFFDFVAISCYRFTLQCQTQRQDGGTLCVTRSDGASLGLWKFERPRPFGKLAVTSGKSLWPST